jgi:hypothetical protein
VKCAACGLLAALCLIGTAAPALAQGRPNGVPPGLARQPKPKTTGSATADPSPAPPPVTGADTASGVARFRSFGSWLDDATVLSPGETWLTLSAQRWASPSFDGAGLPVADVAIGVTKRVQAFATFPVTRYGYPGEPRTQELGDMFAGGKIVLREADGSRIGLSVSPALEIVGSSTMVESGMPRVSFVLPINLELQQSGGRIYASGGFFTRGAWFAGGALERQLSDALVATGGLTFMGAKGDARLSDSYGLHHRRLDGFGSLSWFVSPSLVLFGSAGRTLSSLDLDATRYAFTLGASLNVHRPGPRPPVVR